MNQQRWWTVTIFSIKEHKWINTTSTFSILFDKSWHKSTHRITFCYPLFPLLYLCLCVFPSLCNQILHASLNPNINEFANQSTSFCSQQKSLELSLRWIILVIIFLKKLFLLSNSLDRRNNSRFSENFNHHRFGLAVNAAATKTIRNCLIRISMIERALVALKKTVAFWIAIGTSARF